MTTDLGIVYHAKLIEIKDNLKQLEELGIKTSRFEMAIQEIEDNVEEKVRVAYANLEHTNSNTFLENTLIIVYNENINQLDSINRYIITEYELYYQIYTRLNNLKTKELEINVDNIDFFVQESKDLLRTLKTSTTIDYEVEKTIVEEVYLFIYKILKLEIIYTNKASLLEYVKNNEVDVLYICNLIKEDIHSLERNEENTAIFSRYQELKENGFQDIHILDKKLITLITLVKHEELIDDMKNTFMTELDQYEESNYELVEIQNNNVVASEKIQELKHRLRGIFWRRFGKKLGLIVNFAFLGISLPAVFKFCKEKAIAKEYQIVTTVYDSSKDGFTTTEEYGDSIEDSLTMVEYSVWDKPGYFREGYQRTIYTYDLSNLNVSYENLVDYLDSELKGQIPYTITTDTSIVVPEDVDDTENKYIITSIVQDKNEYHLLENKSVALTSFILFGMAILAVDGCIMVLFSENSIKLRRQKKASKLEIKQNKQLLLENKVRLDDLRTILLKRKEEVLVRYQELPLSIQEDSEIQEKVLKLKSDN